MQGAQARAQQQGRIVGAHAAAGQNLDTARRARDEGLQHGGAFGRALGGAGGQHGIEAERDGVVQRGERIGRQIEAAVQGGFQPGLSRPAAQIGQRVRIERAVGQIGAEDHARQSGFGGGGDIVAHDGQFGVVVGEVPGARADHGAHRDAAAARPLHEAARRRQAAFAQGRAQFDAVGAVGGGGAQAGGRVDADFQQRPHASALSLVRPFGAPRAIRMAPSSASCSGSASALRAAGDSHGANTGAMPPTRQTLPAPSSSRRAM